jgi:hypothetical protein
MFKMSTCGVGLLLAGLVACSTTGPSDCERAGGTCESKSPGACLGGWSPNTDGYSCGSSTTFCCFPLSYSPCETAGGTCLGPGPATCPDGTIDDTSQYGCSNGGGPSICCMPSANGGASGVGGASGGAGGSGATGGSGGSVGIGGGGSGGTSGGTGGTVSCVLPAVCFVPACAGELQPAPCGCPICVPKPDAGVAKDAGLADTQLPACPMLTKLNSTDAAQVGYSAARGLLKCDGTAGDSDVCVGNDPGSGCGSALGDSVGCSNLCAANQYGLAYGVVGPYAPPSIDLPAGCGSGMYTPAGVEFYCCPCGT